jgi:Family of unknown function (DUF6807)
MTPWNRGLIVAVLCGASGGALTAVVQEPARASVQVLPRENERRVDVLVNGREFTSYRFETGLKKPVLFPIVSAGGVTVTRGYPLDPRPGERSDHPHHVGHWFNFGDVNGFDFWGFSDETPAENLPRMGTIVHTGIAAAHSGGDAGVLRVTADWVAASGQTLLKEMTTFTFREEGGRRDIDRRTTWTAAEEPVTFGDTKEGAFGIRVARGLEHPSTEPATFVDSSGKKETVPVLDNSGAAGEYLASDGRTGESVWGTRGPWMALRGSVEGAPVTVAIFDHPSNHGYPTHWHARGYGLFAANPFGQHAFDPSEPVASFVLEPGQSLTFQHRIAIWDGRPDGAAIGAQYESFAGSGR